MDKKLIVFTKSWQEESLSSLAERVSSMGFEGLELPVRLD